MVKQKEKERDLEKKKRVIVDELKRLYRRANDPAITPATSYEQVFPFCDDPLDISHRGRSRVNSKDDPRLKRPMTRLVWKYSSMWFGECANAWPRITKWTCNPSMKQP